MVYESDFYTTRRPYSSRPNVSSYSVTSPRYYSVTDTPNRPRTAQEQYSYSYSSKSATARDSNNPYGRPETSSQSTTVQRSSATGPYGHNYTTERSSTTGSRPGDYSYTSTASRASLVYRAPEYPTVLHHSIPYVAHKRLVTGTRISTTPSRVISRIVTSPIRSVTPFRAYTPIRAYTPVRAVSPLRYTNPITSVSVLSAPSRYIHSYTARCSTSPIRSTYTVRVRPSIINREFKRIENLVRTTPYHSHTESFLNSDVSRNFDDETKEIRNASNSLLRKVHQRVQRSHSVLPVTAYSSKYERRYGPDSFVSSLSGPLKSTIYNGIESYNPNKYIGKSHLASVRIVGNKAYNKRYPTTCYDDDKVRNDVNLLSFYLKNRKAAESKDEPQVPLASAKLKAEVN